MEGKYWILVFELLIRI
jgi:hypothetical protein